MKKLMIALAGMAAFIAGAFLTNLTVPSQAHANGLAQNLCTYVEGNDRLRLRQRLREDRIQLRRIYSDVLCNGNSMLQFAMTSGSQDIGEFIASQLPSSVLEAAGDLEWAENHGYGDSAIAKAIRDRLSS